MSSAALTRARHLLHVRHRRAERLFLAEGPHVVRDALDASAPLVELFVAQDVADDAEVAALRARADAAHAAVHVVAPRELKSISDTETPQGVVAVVRLPDPPRAPFAKAGLWVLLEGVQDPGNVGTLLRAAEAFGASGVYALPGTADLWSGKVVRSAQGAHFRLVLDARVDAAELFRDAGGELWAATRDGDSVYAAPAPPRLCALVLGSEARGLSDAVLAASARRVSVPHRGAADSLNVAMAGSILLSWISELRARGAR